MSSPGPAVVLLSLLVSQALSQDSGCPGPLERLISGESFRVKDRQITASSIWSNNYLPPQARIEPGQRSWCAESGRAENSWIQVDFETCVIIHNLEIGGDDGFFFGDYYLTEFHVEHGPNDTHLSPIFLPNSTQPMVFTREGTADVRTTTLPTPITTRVLRIRRVTNHGSVPCVFLEANGCVQPPGNISVTPTLTVQPSATSQYKRTSMATAVATPPPITDSGRGASVGAIAGGSAAGAVVLLVLLLLLVLLVVCLLAKKPKGKRLTNQDGVAYSRTGSVRIVDNEIYGKETPPTSPGSTDKGFGIPNEPDCNTYESLKSPATNAMDLTNAATHDSIPSPRVKAANETETYEPVGSPVVYSYAIVDTPIKVGLPGDSEKGTADSVPADANVTSANGVEVQCGSMVDNALYERADPIEDSMAQADNPMYGGVHPETTVDERDLINNPLYDAT